MQHFPAALLILSPCPVPTGSPAGDALENIITYQLADGAFCYVMSTKSQYQLDKASSAAADGVSIIAPIAGPGRWLRLSVGGGLLEYGQAKLATPQAIGGTANLILDSTGIIRGLSYTPATGTWLLTAGKTYRLTGHGYADTFSDPAGFLKIQWVDDNNAVLLGVGMECPPAFLFPETTASAITTEPTSELIYTAPATVVGRSVKLRVTALNGSANLPASSWTAIVQELG